MGGPYKVLDLSMQGSMVMLTVDRYSECIVSTLPTVVIQSCLRGDRVVIARAAELEKRQRQHDKQAALRQDLLAQQAEARRRAAQARIWPRI